jgi:hypothetical protein
MKIGKCISNPAVAAVAITIASLLPISIVSAHDMGAMTEPMTHAMAPNAMGGHMHMDEHMQMTEARPATPEDLERARNILATLRRSVARYRDYRVALAQGMRIFLPTIPQDVYHFTDFNQAAAEYQGHFDLSHPGSLLYTKNADGSYSLIGAMYSAPIDATPAQLDEIVPLGVARWHKHTNICLPNGFSLGDILRGDIGAQRSDVPGMIPVSTSPNAVELNRQLGFLADGRFGFEGKIADARECTAAGGYLIPEAFGWMVHIYPFSGDDLKVAFGMSVPELASKSPSASR